MAQAGQWPHTVGGWSADRNRISELAGELRSLATQMPLASLRELLMPQVLRWWAQRLGAFLVRSEENLLLQQQGAQFNSSFRHTTCNLFDRSVCPGAGKKRTCFQRLRVLAAATATTLRRTQASATPTTVLQQLRGLTCRSFEFQTLHLTTNTTVLLARHTTRVARTGAISQNFPEACSSETEQNDEQPNAKAPGIQGFLHVEWATFNLFSWWLKIPYITYHCLNVKPQPS